MSDDEYQVGAQEEIDEGIAIDGGRGTIDGLLEVLTSRRRRRMLYYFQEHEVTTLNALATHIAAVEEGISSKGVSATQTDRMSTTLVHQDLPLLMDTGLIEYDHRSGAIRYEEPPAILDGFLQLAARVDQPEK